MKPLQLTAVLVASLLSTGCALTTDRISLEYRPMAGTQVVQGAEGITVQVAVKDLRADRTRVSCKKNGFGMEMAPILAEEDPAITIRRALEAELKARGFQIGTEAIVSIQSDITRFWNDHKTGFFAGDSVADLNMSVAVKNRAGDITLFTKQIGAQGIESNIQIQGGNNAKLALDKALANGVRLLFEDPAFLEALLKARSS
ncbi:MAG: hypothetical protein IPP58_03060 [Holophagaceae bacterium]|uniref:Lipoprotein n=1 Tax=Candidatus Geothrix skivensis TaxID=2954439 RepID=A0A9D7SDA3_9BACT|nr:hypothetical protein [Candidatus Geothrix skivensis]